MAVFILAILVCGVIAFAMEFLVVFILRVFYNQSRERRFQQKKIESYIEDRKVRRKW